jgi:CDP-diacylglycerol--serine O-phosphatidyltransferase
MTFIEIVVFGKNRGLKNQLSNIQIQNLTIPNIVTYLTLTFSLVGIFLLLNGHVLIWALLLWTACDIFDTLDGYIAKKFNIFSPLGADLDSLVDVIAFLIPPFLIALQSEDNFLFVASFIFVFSGIYRLARFNVVKNSPGEVVGLQASLAAHLIYLAVLIGISSQYLSIIYILLSLLMISPIKSGGRSSLYLTAFLMALNTIIIGLKLF